MVGISMGNIKMLQCFANQNAHVYIKQ